MDYSTKACDFAAKRMQQIERIDRCLSEEIKNKLTSRRLTFLQCRQCIKLQKCTLQLAGGVEAKIRQLKYIFEVTDKKNFGNFSINV
jgi:hypothetical protein